MGNGKVKKILVPVDESERSVKVIEKAIEMATTFNASIVLLHVRNKISSAVGHPYYQQILDKQLKQADEMMAPHKVRLEQCPQDFEVLILEGDPAEAITDAAECEKCDLIVMGTRGLSNIKVMALGSVSNKVLHTTDCMVLMVP